MGWSGSCGSVGCWWACGRGAVAAFSCRMAGRMSESSSQQWAAAHVLSGEAGGRVAERCTIGWATRAGGGVLALPFCSPRALTLWGVVVMLVVRVVWVPGWMIVPLAVLLRRVVWALA